MVALIPCLKCYLKAWISPINTIENSKILELIWLLGVVEGSTCVTHNIYLAAPGECYSLVHSTIHLLIDYITHQMNFIFEESLIPWNVSCWLTSLESDVIESLNIRDLMMHTARESHSTLYWICCVVERLQPRTTTGRYPVYRLPVSGLPVFGRPIPRFVTIQAWDSCSNNCTFKNGATEVLI